MVKYIHVDRCDSTQDLLKEQLMAHSDTTFTVSCEHQLHGRGRGDHTWEDSPGTLCFSMNVPAHSKTTFTALEMSLLVCRFFELEGNKLKLKWPNDILNKHGKKCGGILVQNFDHQYLAGIGINLFYEGTSFGGISDSAFHLDKKSWCKELSLFIRENRYVDTISLIADWQNRCAHMKELVVIIESDQEISGFFLGLGEYGEAILENGGGIHRLFNGSLSLI